MARDTLIRTRKTLEKSAYVAVGIPASLIGMLKDRWEGTRETIDDIRDGSPTMPARRSTSGWKKERSCSTVSGVSSARAKSGWSGA